MIADTIQYDNELFVWSLLSTNYFLVYERFEPKQYWHQSQHYFSALETLLMRSTDA